MLEGQDTDTTDIPISPALFQAHIPLVIDNDALRKSTITNGHEGGIAVYIHVGDYPQLASERAFFSNGIQTYAVIEDELEFHEINTFLRIDSIVNQGGETHYIISTYKNGEIDQWVEAIINNDTPTDMGPTLKSMIPLRKSEED
jgi:hypothetical protein